MCNVEDGAVVAWNFFIVRKKEMASRAAACIRFTEVAGIAVDGQYHVAALVGDIGQVLP